ncbi:MAG: SRPBCC family protein [Gemmatimonadota bacterium]
MTVTAQQVQDAPSTDRIEKRVELRASRSRVWRAITTAEEFGAWFRVSLDGEFAEGATVRGDVTNAAGGYVCSVEMQVERIEPERYFSYRWHPYPMDPAVDYSAEPTTLVEFILQETEGGTAVTIVESGFDRIPLARRAEAFRMNDRGWEGQARNLARYVE